MKDSNSYRVLNDLLKGGKKAEIGETRKWGKYTVRKEADGWKYVDGPHKGKIYGKAGRSKVAKPDDTPKKAKQNQEVKSPKTTEANVTKPDDKPAKEPASTSNKPNYSVANLIEDRVVAKDGKKYRGLPTGKRSKVEYKSPKGTDTNLVGHVAFGKATVAMQQKLNEKLANAEILLDDMGIRFKTPVDFVCQSMRATANEAASYSNMAQFDMNHRIDLRHETSLQKSLMHEIGHAIDYSTGPEKDSRQGYLSHAVLEGKEFQDLKDDLEALDELANKSDYYQRSKTGKFGRYLREKTEVFARGFEVYSYVRAKKLVEAGKLDAMALEDFTPDFVKGALNPGSTDLEKQNPEIKELREEVDQWHEKIDVARRGAYLAMESKDERALSEAKADFNTAVATYKKKHAKLSQLRRAARANQAVENADEILEQAAGIMDRILNKVEFRKALRSVDLVGMLIKAQKDDEIYRMTARMKLRKGGTEALLQYIQTLRDQDPKLAERVYQDVYPEGDEGQDTDLGQNPTPEIKKSKWLDVGTKIEMEHTRDEAKARRIAQDHLNEDPDYYKDWDAKEKILFEPKAPKLKKGKNVPANPKLYARVKAAAKKKFDVYPSAYANGWLVQEYKKRGGTYKSFSEDEVNDMVKGLDKWFKEDWVDISRKKDDGSHPECGRKDADEGKYPKCVPKSKADSMSSDDKASAVRRKRQAESKQDREGKKPINVKTDVKKSLYGDDCGLITDDLHDMIWDEIEEGTWLEPADLEKAEDAKGPLNKPMRDSDGSKKFKVYVKDPSTGNVKTVRFGDPNMEIKRDDPESRSNFRARHGCDNPGPRTKAKYWSCKMWSKRKVSNIAKSLENLFKTKTVTKNGIQYYAEGPNKGKQVGTVRGTGQSQSSSGSQGQSKKPDLKVVGSDEQASTVDQDQRAEAVYNLLNTEEFVPGRVTTTGKKMATNTESATRMGYTPDDFSNASDYYSKQQERIGEMIQSGEAERSPKLTKLMKKYRNLEIAMNNGKQRIEQRRAKTEVDQQEKMKQQAESKKVEKAITMMNAYDPRDIDTTGNMIEQTKTDPKWLERLHNLMDGYQYGDVPRVLELDKAHVHLAKVDDGLYTGFIKRIEQVEGGELVDTDKIRLERQTLPELVSTLMAKEYIMPEKALELDQPNPGAIQAEPQELQDLTESMAETKPEPSPLDKKIRILELIQALTSV